MSEARNPHGAGDRDANWSRTYHAETRQREAEALFQAKGIPLPEPDAKRTPRNLHDDFRMNSNREEILFALALERPLKIQTAFLGAMRDRNAVTMLSN